MANGGITKAELADQLQSKLKKLKSDLAEAGSPASLVVEVFGGSLGGFGLTRGVFKGMDVLLRVKEGEQPGFFRKNPTFTKGLVAGVVGLASGAANLAVPYTYPMSYPRAMALQGSVAMMTMGLDRIIDGFPTAPAAALPPKQQ